MTKAEEIKVTGLSYKHPVFDENDRGEFKEWWDSVYASLEMEDLEEYVSIEYNEIDIPSKKETMDETLKEDDKKGSYSYQERDEKGEGAYGTRVAGISETSCDDCSHS